MSDAKTPIGQVAKYVKEEIPAQVAKAVSEIEVPKGEDGSDGLGFDLSNWNPGIYREGTTVQHNIGQAYKALADTNDEPGTTASWERVGSSGFRWTGVKSVDNNYMNGDLYIDGGTTFLWNEGKGYMLAQRGRNGKNGIDGIHGKNGSDAPTMIDMTIVGKDLVAVFSDGNMHTVNMPQIEEIEDVKKQLTWLEEQMLNFENVKAPIKGYEGVWENGKSYSKGDLVTVSKGLYLCIRTDSNSISMDPEKWVKLSGSSASSGSGSGGSAKWPPVVNAALPMQGYIIDHLANARTGPDGSHDAINRLTMEKSIAAQSLFQGTYEITPNKPDLSKYVDSSFELLGLTAGKTINEPSSSTGFTRKTGENTVWFNWKGNGFDNFSASILFPKALELSLSNGDILNGLLPPKAYADESELAAEMAKTFTKALGVSKVGVYVNGSDCWIAIDTPAPVYATKFLGQDASPFAIPSVGPNNKALNTYNWIVETKHENIPEALPAGLPGIAPGTIAKNSDRLQWSSITNTFTLLKGSSLTTSFADARYYKVTEGNMAWQAMSYSRGAIVYEPKTNAWYTALKDLDHSSPWPGAVAGTGAWRKINSTFGATVFFGKGDFDLADTSVANNWGMPTGTYPSAQQPLNGDTYFDVQTGATTSFKVTANAPIFVVTTHIDLADTKHQIGPRLTLDQLQNIDPTVGLVPPPTNSYYRYNNETGKTIRFKSGPFYNKGFNSIGSDTHALIIYTGDPGVGHKGWILTTFLNTDRGSYDLPNNTVNPQPVPDTVAAVTKYGYARNFEWQAATLDPKTPHPMTVLSGFPDTTYAATITITDMDTVGSEYSFMITSSGGKNIQLTPISIMAHFSFIDQIVAGYSATEGGWIGMKSNLLESALHPGPTQSISNRKYEIRVQSYQINLEDVVAVQPAVGYLTPPPLSPSTIDTRTNYPGPALSNFLKMASGDPTASIPNGRAPGFNFTNDGIKFSPNGVLRLTGWMKPTTRCFAWLYFSNTDTGNGTINMNNLELDNAVIKSYTSVSTDNQGTWLAQGALVTRTDVNFTTVNNTKTLKLMPMDDANWGIKANTRMFFEVIIDGRDPSATIIKIDTTYNSDWNSTHELKIRAAYPKSAGLISSVYVNQDVGAAATMALYSQGF